MRRLVISSDLFFRITRLNPYSTFPSKHYSKKSPYFCAPLWLSSSSSPFTSPIFSSVLVSCSERFMPMAKDFDNLGHRGWLYKSGCKLLAGWNYDPYWRIVVVFALIASLRLLYDFSIFWFSFFCL